MTVVTAAVITLAAHGLVEHMQITLIFCKNHQFHVIYCVTITYVLYFEEFLTPNSR